MGILNFVSKKKTGLVGSPAQPVTGNAPADTAALAKLALNTIHDGVIIVNKDRVIRFINPAAVDMVGCGNANNAVNLDLSLVLKIEVTDGAKVDGANNEIMKSITANQAFESRDYVILAGQDERKTPVAIDVTPSGDARSDRIITFRNISKELEEEGAQTEFVSTASHEMRTPVASIEGYLGLALNPQTATIDARARQYLEAAHSSSQHLGRLFKDLLDVTKLDDHRIRPHPVPLELNGFVKRFADGYLNKFQEKKLTYSFGANDSRSKAFAGRVLEQVVYTFADPDFLGEILANLIENAIKYTPEGGAIWVNVQGDGDRALINVTDTGIGIAAEDLQHIFQKFYRADNSHTRTVGGTGLGLYLVKQRTESMGGKVWAESAFGEGSTFYVSLPRLTSDEYEKRKIALENEKAVQSFQAQVKTADMMATQNAHIQAQMAPQFNSAVMGAAPVTSAQTLPAMQPPQPVAPSVSPVASQLAQPVQPAQPIVPTMQSGQLVTQPIPPAQLQSMQPQPAGQMAQASAAQTASVSPYIQQQPVQQPVQSIQQPVQPQPIMQSQGGAPLQNSIQNSQNILQ